MKDQEFEHESYVLVSFSRRQGSPKLFASLIDQHHSYITLQVRKTVLRRSDTGDRFDASMAADVVEVDMSAAQFAELLTTMNIGMGVPGTMRRCMGKFIEAPPDLPGEVEYIKEDFANELKSFSDKILGEKLPRVRNLLNQKTLTKVERQELLFAFEAISNKLKDSVPFILDMFNEAVIRRVTAAKTEIDSLWTTVLHKAGIKQLQGKQD
jgi:hypothetical protein